MPKQTEAGKPVAASSATAADDVIEEFNGDPRAAVMALLKVVVELQDKNETLRRAASVGFARRWPADIQDRA